MPMAVSSIEELQKATTELLKEASAEGQLSKLTVRIVREKLEKRLELLPGTLNAKEYKAPIKKTVVDYLENNSAPESEVDEEESQLKPSKRRKVIADEEPVNTLKSTYKPKTSSKGTKGRQIPKFSAVVASDASESPEDEVPTRKKDVKPSTNKASSEFRSEDDDKHEAKPIASKRSQKASETKNSTGKSSVKLYKSAAMIESSGDEADSGATSKPVVKASKKEMQSPRLKEKPLSKPKSTNKRKTEQSDDESKPGASSSPKSKVYARNEPESDSSLSMVIDEPPKKRNKKQDKDSSKKSPTEQKKARKSNTGGLSKDDEAVSKLKAIVVACGVRKVWKKEFADLETPSGQIKRLKEILKDLGMSGRPSLDRAKSIRAQRELAQELRDVQEFAEASLRREMNKEKGASEDESSRPGTDDEDERPKAKKRTAGASILAFLQDQSDDE